MRGSAARTSGWRDDCRIQPTQADARGGGAVGERLEEVFAGVLADISMASSPPPPPSVGGAGGAGGASPAAPETGELGAAPQLPSSTAAVLAEAGARVEGGAGDFWTKHRVSLPCRAGARAVWDHLERVAPARHGCTCAHRACVVVVTSRSYGNKPF